MRNPLKVFVASLDHHTNIIHKIFPIYKWFKPHVFEYYCVFCRGICNCWWEDYWNEEKGA